MAKKKYIYIQNLKIRIEVSEAVFEENCHFNNHEEYLQKKDKNNGCLLYSELEDGDLYVEKTVTDRNQSSTEEQVELKLMIEKMRLCLDLLPEEDKRIIKALFYDELSERELSEKTGFHNMTIHNKKMKILGKLKKLMEK